MKPQLLINFLTSGFRFAFYFCIILLVYLISIDVFTENGTLGNFLSENHHSKGYSTPVTIKNHFKKPLFNNKHTINIKESTNAKGQHFKSGESIFYNKFPDSIALNTPLISIDFYEKEELFKIKQNTFISEGYVRLKSSHTWLTLCQLLKFYGNLIFSTLVFFLFYKLFKSLKTLFNFSPLITKKVRFIGYILIAKPLLNVILNYIIGSQYNRLTIENYNGTYFSSQNQIIQINPILDFDLTTFIIGISLLVLSYLLNHGYNLSKENELTI